MSASGNKRGFLVRNERDLQELLHALLMLEFDDVRREERMQSIAGGSTSLDFLIRPYGIGIETKMARRGLSTQEIGSQLLADIARYRLHPDCRVLYCFIYDPGGYVKNPRGLEQDLEKYSDRDFNIKVDVRPIRV
jgi:hypothetical protein